MRITLGMITNGIRNSINENAQSLLDAQNRASSGKRIQRPSDDVPGTGRSLGLRSALSAIDQFDRNSATAKGVLSATSDALTGIANSLQKVRALQMTNGTSALNSEGRTLIASQLKDIEADLANIANTKYLGRYLFSGNLTDTQAVTVDGAGAYVYQGDAANFSIQIAPGVQVVANTTADQVLNMGGVARAGVPDVFQTIESLRTQVLAGNVQAVSDKLADVDELLANVTGIRSQLGGRINRLDSSTTALQDTKLKLTERLSSTEDVDIAESIVDLQTRQNVYQAALGVAGKILGQPTLVDYMK
jgi:flagellar hook-associated protein 3 FlgL